MQDLKSHFLTELFLKPIGKNLWLTTAPLVYWDQKLKLMITVPANFQSNLFSVPLIFRGFFPVSWGKTDGSAVLHDWIVENNKVLKISYFDCQRIFLESLRILGASKYQMYAGYLAVLLGCWYSWNKYEKNLL